MPFFYPTTDYDIKGKNLVVPIVSIANVPQLTSDLLIASLSLRRVGIFDPRYLIPVVSGRDDGEEGLTTPLELYGREGIDVLVIQQRSPVINCFKQNFIAGFMTFIQEAGLASVLFMSGVSLINRTDAQMFTPTYHLHHPNEVPLLSSPLARLTELQIPVYTSPPSHNFPPDTENESAIPFIPGGGITRRMLSALPNDWPIPTAALLQFVMEGDNRADALTLAAVVAKVFDLNVAEWKEPASWRQGLFGPPPNGELYS